MSRSRRVRIRARFLPFILILLSSCGHDGLGPPDKPAVCPRIGDYIHVSAVGRPPGSAQDAAVSGTSAFSIGPNGLFAMDISDPSDVRVAGSITSLTGARAIESAGPWLVIANGDNGVAIMDATTPYAPAIVRTVPVPGTCVDVRVSGERAYVANDPLGLVIIDLSDPVNASVLGIENTPGKAAGVAATGSLAFVIHEPSELRVVNVSNPTAPFIIESIQVPGFVEGVDVQGDLVAIAVGQAGCQLVDVSSPSAPKLAGLIDTQVDALGVALAGDVAFVADRNGGVPFFDISDVMDPVAMGTLGTVKYSYNAVVSDDHLVTADDFAGVRVFDITPPVPAPYDSLLADGDIRSMASLGDLVVAADATFGLRVVDPATRSIVGQFPMVSPAKDVVVVDSVAYALPLLGKPAIVDLHNPSMPVDAGTFGSSTSSDHVVVSGNTGYLIEQEGWLYQDQIDPPQNLGLFHDIAVTWVSLAVDRHFALGDIVYVPNQRSGVLIIPAYRMTPVNEIAVAGSPQRVVIEHVDGPSGPGTSSIAYIAETGFNSGQAGVEIFDVTDVNAPVRLGGFACAGNASDITFSGDRVVVGSGDDGAEVFDLLQNGRVRPAGMLLAPAYRVTVSNTTLVAAGRKSGVLLLSLDDCLP